MREDPSQAPRGGRPAQSPPTLSGQGHVDRSQPLWQRAASREAPPHPLQSYREASPPAWPPSPDQRPAAAPHPPQRGGPPPTASYLAEDNQTYTLRDLAAGEETQVPKRRAAPEAFPPSPQNHAPGVGLLRASGFALLGALLGGAPGVALGVVVAVVALVRLERFERRARSWRAKAEKGGQAQRLPARATSERLRLMTALWQSLGAVAFGGAALLLLLTALR
jgi:hypothetical protein